MRCCIGVSKSLNVRAAGGENSHVQSSRVVIDQIEDLFAGDGLALAVPHGVLLGGNAREHIARRTEMIRRVPGRVSEKLAPRGVPLFLPDRVNLRQLAFSDADVDRRRLGIIDIAVVRTRFRHTCVLRARLHNYLSDEDAILGVRTSKLARDHTCPQNL